MSGNYSMGKRRRDAEKARKKKERAARRERKRRDGPQEVPISDVDEVTGDLERAERQAAERSEDRGAKAIPSRLFVGSLSWETNEQDLRDAFGRFGTVSDAVVICDRDTGKSRGFGFVVMEDRADAARAIEALHGSELDGREIVVNVATGRNR